VSVKGKERGEGVWLDEAATAGPDQPHVLTSLSPPIRSTAKKAAAAGKGKKKGDDEEVRHV